MKIYRVRASIEHPKTGKEIYALVELESAKDRTWINMSDTFDGKPFPKKWRPVTLKWVHPERPRPDFLNFDNKVLTFSEGVLDALKGCLAPTGELLPVAIARESGMFYLHNIDGCLNALDAAKSEWRVVTPDWKTLRKPAFRPEKIGNENLFKLREDFGLKIYCVERTGSAEDGEFKALVDSHRFTGLQFELVWTDDAISKSAKERSTDARATVARQVVTKNASATDRALTKGEEKELQTLIKSGYEDLQLDPDKASAVEVQKAIRGAVDEFLRSAKRPTKGKAIDLGTTLGAAWGHSFCKALKWEWRVVTLAGKTLLVITPRDRAHVIAPIGFMTQQIQKKPPEENTSLLLFQMAKARSLQKAKAGAYLQVG